MMKVSLLRTRTIIFPMKAKMQTLIIADGVVRGKHRELSELATLLHPKAQQLIPLSVTQSPAQPLDTHLSSALNSPMALPYKRYVLGLYIVLRAHAHSSRGSSTLLLLEAPDWSIFTSPPPATGGDIIKWLQPNPQLLSVGESTGRVVGKRRLRDSYFL